MLASLTPIAAPRSSLPTDTEPAPPPPLPRTPQAVANLARGFAKLDHYSYAFMRAALKAYTERSAEYQPREVCSLLWAATRLRFHPEVRPCVRGWVCFDGLHPEVRPCVCGWVCFDGLHPEVRPCVCGWVCFDGLHPEVRPCVRGWVCFDGLHPEVRLSVRGWVWLGGPAAVRYRAGTLASWVRKPESCPGPVLAV